MAVNIVIGSQWGDEGKAKVIDYLADKTDIIARYQGGPNAGHTVVVEGKKYVFHLIPSGILYPDKICVLGNGVVINLETFFAELDNLEKNNIEYKDRMFLSDASHLILPFHRTIDAARENLLKENKIGTTKRGIGMAYGDKMMRIGLRMGDILDPDVLKSRLKVVLDQKNLELEQVYGLPPQQFQPLYDQLLEQAERVRPMVVNTSWFLNDQHARGKNILLEGAQGMGLDVDFGTYPYVTSSNPTVGGALTGSGMSYRHIDRVYAVVKAYTTRVGEGPFPTELHGDEGEDLRQRGSEFGATTGRPRRCGWFDVPIIRQGARVNGYTGMALTKIDILAGLPEIKIGVAYRKKGQRLEEYPSVDLEGVEVEYETLPGWQEDISGATTFEELPENCRRYIARLEELTEVPVKILSVGPGRKDTIVRE